MVLPSGGGPLYSALTLVVAARKAALRFVLQRHARVELALEGIRGAARIGRRAAVHGGFRRRTAVRRRVGRLCLPDAGGRPRAAGGGALGRGGGARGTGAALALRGGRRGGLAGRRRCGEASGGRGA